MTRRHRRWVVNTCSGVAAPGLTAHVTPRSLRELHAVVGHPWVGRVAIDSANAPANGCIGAGSVIALPVLEPDDAGWLQANNRVSTYHNTSTFRSAHRYADRHQDRTITCPAEQHGLHSTVPARPRSSLQQ